MLSDTFSIDFWCQIGDGFFGNFSSTFLQTKIKRSENLQTAFGLADFRQVFGQMISDIRGKKSAIRIGGAFLAIRARKNEFERLIFRFFNRFGCVFFGVISEHQIQNSIASAAGTGSRGGSTRQGSGRRAARRRAFTEIGARLAHADCTAGT